MKNIIHIKAFAQNKSEICKIEKILLSKYRKDLSFIRLPVKTFKYTLRTNYYGQGYAWNEKYNYKIHRANISLANPTILNSILKHFENLSIYLNILCT